MTSRARESQDDPRTLHVDGLVKARDLGGLRGRDGSTTPSQVFYRSEGIDRVTPAGWSQVFEAGIRTVVDLRQPGERAQDTNPRPDWLITVPVDLDGPVDTPFWADYWENGLCGTALYYLPHFTTLPERSVAALSAIVDDYLHTVRLGDARAVHSDRTNEEPLAEALCQEHGTPTEGAFRNAARQLDLTEVLRAERIADHSREALRTWRGHAVRAHVGSA